VPYLAPRFLSSAIALKSLLAILACRAHYQVKLSTSIRNNGTAQIKHWEVLGTGVAGKAFFAYTTACSRSHSVGALRRGMGDGVPGMVESTE
jgi:hypothetical protein